MTRSRGCAGPRRASQPYRFDTRVAGEARLPPPLCVRCDDRHRPRAIIGVNGTQIRCEQGRRSPPAACQENQVSGVASVSPSMTSGRAEDRRRSHGGLFASQRSSSDGARSSRLIVGRASTCRCRRRVAHPVRLRRVGGIAGGSSLQATGRACLLASALRSAGRTAPWQRRAPIWQALHRVAAHFSSPPPPLRARCVRLSRAASPVPPPWLGPHRPR
jgi:hypothetical protein